MCSWSKCKGYIILSILFLFLINEVIATGILYVRPRFSSTPYEKVWIKSIDVDATIQDQVSVTHVDQVFFNELTSSAEAVYIFPLPENAMITELFYWVNGERFEAEIRERQDAINDYNQKLREWLDPALLEYLGDNLFRLKIVPVNAQSEFRTEITYVEMLNYDFGISKYKYLMNTLELSSQPLQTVHFDLTAESQNPYKYFDSPSHENSPASQIDKISDFKYTFEFGDENFFPDTDVQIQFETLRESVEYSLLTYNPTPADSFGTDSFFALWITPPDSIAEDDALPKDIVFTADVSSSMEGMRILQVKESLYSFLDKLSPQDRFNIITFGTHVVPFKSDLVKADAQNISDANDFIYQMYALGMTNINAALDSSFKQSYRDTVSKNLIFLTDGKPTFGETRVDSIVNRAQRNNKNEVRLFSFGVGEDIDKALLTKLSLDNYGYATFITADDSIALFIDNHFKRISKPVMTNLELDYGGLAVWDRYPKTIQDLYWGTNTMEMGLYNGSGMYNVTLTGQIRGDIISIPQTKSFSDEPGGHRFVPRLWARGKIDHLLDMISIYGETEELVTQVIQLSLTFQILTPYTALYVDPTSIDEKSKVVPGQFKLYANYPNPFNPETTIRYNLPADQSTYRVVIRIYDVLGQLVITLREKQQGPGMYQLTWDGRNSAGQAVPSGVYFLTLEAGSFKASQKMLLVK